MPRMEQHRGEIGGALLVSAVACWIAAVPVASATGSSWTSPATLSLVVGGLLCLVLALWALGFWGFTVRLATAVTKRRKVASATEETGAVLADASVEAIRKQGRVRPMLAEENELPLGELPDGIYGFTVPWAIEPLRTHRSNYDHLPLSSEGGGTAVAELHKHAGGGIALVGYLTADEVVALRNPYRNTRLDVVLRLEPDTTRMAVSIPLGLITSARNRHLGSSYVLDLGLKPAGQQ